jgi:hypothetical protein
MTTTTKTSNITDQLSTAPSIAITYELLLDADTNATKGVTAFVQEFKGKSLEEFDIINLSLHQWKNWKFATKNGIKQTKTAIKKPQKIATKISAIRTYLKHDQKITSKTDFETIRKFVSDLNNEKDLSPEQAQKENIKKSLKGLSIDQLKAISEFITKI